MDERPPLDPSLAAELVAAANDPIAVCDLTGTITWVNDASSLLGWGPAELVGRSAFDLVRPVDAGRALPALLAMHDGHQLRSTAPFDVATADGGYLECDTAAWVLGPPGAPTGIAVHLRPTQDSRILRRILERLLAGEGSSVVIGETLDLLAHRSADVRVLAAFVDEDGVPRTIGDDLDPRLAGEGAAPGSVWDRARGTGEAVVVEGVDAFDPVVRGLAVDAGLRDVIVTPVRSEGEHLATISVWVVETGPPARSETYSIPMIRQLIELVLRWRRQSRELGDAARRDALTGLPNRRALAETDAAGERRDLGVLAIDLDRFKPVNDSFGHAAGDHVLRVVAERLQTSVRTDDLVVRMGGDEFAVVCAGIERDVLASIAERVVARVAEPIDVPGGVVTVGASIGAALGHDHAVRLLEGADAALYDAKARGRGAVAWAE